MNPVLKTKGLDGTTESGNRDLKKTILFILLLGITLLSCMENTNHYKNRAFYYWKTVFSITDQDKQILNVLKINRLFVKMFEVNRVDNRIFMTHFISGYKPVEGIETVPVIFMVPSVFKDSNKNEIPAAAGNLVKQVVKMCGSGEIKELQIDYDWVPSTKENYFYFLEVLKKQLAKAVPQAELSVTIRLHQVKYMKTTGVPPVNRGTLMCYNLMDMKKFSKKNTILDISELKKYLKGAANYPLIIDIAVPLYRQILVYDENRIYDIINDVNFELLNNREKFEKIRENTYISKNNQYYYSKFLKLGQKLKVETIDINTAVKAAQYAGAMVSKPGDTLIVYDLDMEYIREATGGKTDKISRIFGD